MIFGAAALLMLIAASGGQERAPAPQAQGRSVTVRHQQIIIRMPGRSRVAAPAGTRLIEWRERRGPRCIHARHVAGATSLRPDSVDLILVNNGRVRAQLQRSCPALDYYRGFYIDTTEDGRICADRDSIRSRAGGECGIDRFSILTAEAP